MLTSTQIRALRAKAHSLKPVVLLGQQGLTANVHFEIDQALHAHELIKVRLNIKDRDEKKQVAQEICDMHQAELIQIIGNILVLYRQKEQQ